MNCINISQSKVDDVLFDFWHKAVKRWDITTADRVLSPLYWYIRTDRISIDRLKVLVTTNNRQRTTIIKRLAQSGSNDELIQSVIEYLDKIKDINEE